jgi:hypothetical protein
VTKLSLTKQHSNFTNDGMLECDPINAISAKNLFHRKAILPNIGESTLERNRTNAIIAAELLPRLHNLGCTKRDIWMSDRTGANTARKVFSTKSL